jgi:hypothetical protein
MGTGAVITLEVRPSKETIGNVDIVAPYTQELINTGTPQAMEDVLVNDYKVQRGAAKNFIRKGRENRSQLVPIRTFGREETTPITPTS